MEVYDLSFLTINKLSDDLIEVIVNEGVELNIDMVEECHDWIRNNLKDPCYLLVNKINAYTYTFKAQQQFSAIPEVKAIAFVVYSRISELATEALTKVPKTSPLNNKIFYSRNEALQWLYQERRDTD